MRYLPHTKADIDAMLETIGKPSLDALFDGIPDKLKTKEEMALPRAHTEWDLDAHMQQVEQEIIASGNCAYFIGAGSYDHFIPYAVKYLISRSEFMTAYTPYQPEVSQGTLQGIYEFQTMITELTDMDVATASHYDCGTALAEALLIALRKKKMNKVAVSSLVHPAHRQVIETYLRPLAFEIIDIPYGSDGRTDFSKLTDTDIAAIAVQSPNFFGNIEDLSQAKQACDDQKAFFVASFTEALSLGLLKAPGSFGADLVAGEGQSLGLEKSFGGPGLGILAGTSKQMRNLPGRLVGKTTDTKGDRGYVLTLATREQHIRREKASSNICSNNGLNAMTAGMYLASVGKKGIREIAQINHDKAVYLKNRLADAGFTFPFDTPFFNEFVAKAPAGFEDTRKRLIEERCIYAGLAIENYFPELKDHYLFCATEKAKKADMDNLSLEVKAL